MTIQEIIFIGLIAIVSDEEIDCKTSIPPDAYVVNPLNVVMLSDDIFHPHYPILWVRRDGVKNPPATCYKTEDRLLETPTNDCTDSQNRWQMYDLNGKRLRIPQGDDAEAKLRKGHRNLGGTCWAGESPAQPLACVKDAGGKSHPDCPKDVSWIPEYAKALGSPFALNDGVYTDPKNNGGAAAVITNLSGTLEASGAESGWRKWNWDWNYPGCPDLGDTYSQKFTTRARVVDVAVDSSDTIWIAPLRTRGPETAIELTGTPVLEIWNLPRKADGSLGVEPTRIGDRCYVPHFDAFNVMHASPPACRRIPYVDAFSAQSCFGPIGINDPFCPPVVFP